MTLRRIAVPAVVAWLVDSVYGYVVYGVLMKDDFARYPAVFRSMETINANLPLMLASSLVAFVAIAYIFAKGHEGGTGIKEGFWFGVVFASFLVFGVAIPNYVTLNIGQALGVKMALCGMLEFVLAGIVLGLLYKPAPSASAARRAAAV
jgi:hypothetical protein